MVRRQKHFARGLPAQHTEQDTPVLSEAKRWLDVYFTGREPDFPPALHPIGSAFRRRVWDLLLRVPYGQTVTLWPGWRSSWPAPAEPFPTCPLRRWAVR